LVTTPSLKHIFHTGINIWQHRCYLQQKNTLDINNHFQSIRWELVAT